MPSPSTPVVLSTDWARVIALRLARQGLIDRTGQSGVVDVVGRMVGLHAQVMSSAELQAAARIDGIHAGDVRDALWERRELVKTWAFRQTLHLLTPGDFGEFVIAARSLERWHTAAWLRYFKLTEPEVSKVLGPLRQGGIEVTAIHNHLLGEVPKVMYVHVHGMGDPVAIAGAVKSALSQTGTPLGPPAAGPAPDPGLDTAALDQALGRTGKATGGIYQYSVGRAEKIMVEGTEMPAGMGVSTVLNFQASSGGQAAVTGDYALVDQEVEPVVDALSGGGIQVTAVHSHSVADAPHLYYLHFFGQGDPAGLARTLRQALDHTNAVRTP